MTLSGRSGTLLVVALVVSLAVNFLAIGFVGVVAGGTLVTRGLLRQATADYPAEFRTAFRREAIAERREIRTALAALREARAAQHRALTAVPYDRGAVDAAQRDVRARVGALTEVLQGVLRESVESLPEEVRRTLPDTSPGLGAIRALGQDETGG
jgi:hypothetical protein